MTPTEGIEAPTFTRPSYIPLSGQVSPNGFPFFASNSSNSPRNTPTPTGQYDSASDAFAFAAVPSPQLAKQQSPQAHTQAAAAGLVNGHADSDFAIETETESSEEDNMEVESTSSTLSNSNITPKATPLLGNSPPTATPIGQLAAAYGTEGLPWNRLGQRPSPSLAV